MIEIFFVTISVLLFLFFSLKNIYHFQISEYRFDRLRAMLNDIGYLKFFDLKIIFPAKSIRNFLILFFATVFLLLINILLFNSIPFYILSILNYIFSKVAVSLGVICSIPFANYQRKKTISKAKQLVKKSNTIFIGVTGSYGKSSVKEFLYEILKMKYRVEKTGGNRNTSIGVAMELIEKLENNPEYFIVEMGAYKIGEIEDICNIVNPKHGILTGLGNQHMDIFGSLDNLLFAKSELLRSLPKDGIAVVNIGGNFNDSVFNDVNAKKITYGEEKKSEYRILDVNNKKRIVFVKFTDGVKRYSFSTGLFGNHHLLNLLAATILSLELGVSYENIQKAIAGIQPMPGKLSLHRGLNDAVIFDDGYNSNLDGFLAALEVIKDFESERKYIFSYGMFELGKEQSSSYKRVIKKIEEYDLILLTLDKKFSRLNSPNVILKTSEKKVLSFLEKTLTKKDLLLLQGRCSEIFLNSLHLRKYES